MSTVIIKSILAVMAAVLVFSGCSGKTESQKDETIAQTSLKPGEYYTCPMHTFVHSDKPGQCPICHMTLVKVGSPVDSNQASVDVVLSGRREVLADVTTEPVKMMSLEKRISAAGKIRAAEPNARQITTRFGGRIETLDVTFVGQRVRRGDPVAEIFSPDAVAAQREVLLALAASKERTSSTGGSSSPIGDLLNQARKKLQFWGFTDSQVQQLVTSGTVKSVVTIYSPISGTVLNKNVELQQYVETGQALFDVADLGKVWLELDLYESDLPGVHIGQKVVAAVDAFPSLPFEGTISFLSPVVEPSTRTIRARAVLDNERGELKPEMYARGTLIVPLAKSLVVPTSAVIATGKRYVVWVEKSPGHFEARSVVLGERAGDHYQVLTGLREGETIAVSGAYLIDSESQLQSSNSDAGTEHLH